MAMFERLTQFLSGKQAPPPASASREKMKPRQWTNERVAKRGKKPAAPAFERFPDTTHPLLLRYQPKMEGLGGENIVYEVAGSPDLVVKAEKKSMEEILAWNEAEGLAPNAESTKVEEVRTTVVEGQRRLYALLKKHFGAEHVLPQKKAVIKVPVSEGMMGELEQLAKFHHDRLPKVVKEAWTIVTMQRRAKALEDPRHLSFNCGNVDVPYFTAKLNVQDPRVRYRYRKYTDALMNAETARDADVSAEGMADFMADSGREGLNVLFNRIWTDPGLRAAVKDFCERAVAFAEESGEVIDLVGRDNLVFFQKPDKTWTYQLIDPLYGFSPKQLTTGREAYIKAPLGEEWDAAKANAFLQGITFTRMINFLGKLSGSEKFYDFLPKMGEEKPDVLGSLMPSLARNPSEPEPKPEPKPKPPLVTSWAPRGEDSRDNVTRREKPNIL